MDFLILLVLLAIARKTEAISERAYQSAHTLIAVILLIVVVIAASMLITSCGTDPITDIQKYKHTGTAEFPGLDPDGYMRKSEALAAGYTIRDGVWIAPWNR